MPTRKAASKVTTIDAGRYRNVQHHPVASGSRAFGAHRLPVDFQTIVDPDKNPPQPWRDLPTPTGAAPFRMTLESILTADSMNVINTSKKLVFHAVGDTGGVNTPTQIENVETYMESDFSGTDLSSHPSFFYHLGDVVYYDGELANYFPEFYEPYMHYPGPIVAIPGNHDGDIDPQTGESSLEGFVRNFCSQASVHSPDAGDAPRTAMTQPNVYWTLLTPLVTIIGLYSNCPEGGQLSQAQIDWFESELKAAPGDCAVIVAVHHPIYSAYGSKPGSQVLHGVLESAVEAAGRVPELVLGGHVHDYQRFTGQLMGKDVPMIIAGAGGYNAKLHVLHKAFHTAKLPVTLGNAGGILENFNDSQHGYLRITVTKKSIVCEYVAVPDPSKPAKGPLKAFDTLTIKTNY
ncbi:MAG TPA: metallophosphoesterase [Terriglobales bacterium]|nr:metallophosphoesterase [Terriglobales bacterium]